LPRIARQKSLQDRGTVLLSRIVNINRTGEPSLCLFLPSGGTEGIDLWEAEGEFKALWFKPETGETFEEKSYTGGDKYAISAPFTGTSVLYLWKE